MDEVDDEGAGHGEGDKDNEPKGIGFPVERKIIVLEVHPVGRENHGWNGHDDGHHGQGLHDIILVAGGGFLVAISGDMMRITGLPKRPAAVNMDIDEDGKIIGLF